MYKGSAAVIGRELKAKRSVYIVDDDIDVRSSMLFFLSTQNLVGNAFESGRAFLDRVHDLAPSPILLDMHMPSMSGLELLAELVEREIHWPVVVLTGHEAVDSAVIAMKLGAMDFLEKPVDGDRTMAALNQAFRLLDENQQHHSARKLARARVASLTARQATVIEGLMRGLSNKQVALDCC